MWTKITIKKGLSMKIKTIVSIGLGLSFSGIAAAAAPQDNSLWCPAVTPKHLYLTQSSTSNESQYKVDFTNQQGGVSTAKFGSIDNMGALQDTASENKIDHYIDLIKTAIIAGKKIELKLNNCQPVNGGVQKAFGVALSNEDQVKEPCDGNH